MRIRLTLQHELDFLRDGSESCILFIMQQFDLQVYHLDCHDFASVLIKSIVVRRRVFSWNYYASEKMEGNQRLKIAYPL